MKKITAPKKQKKWVSWNKNVQHPYETIVKVTKEQELIKAVSKHDSVRVFGNRFSSSDICAGTRALIDITTYDKIVRINMQTKEVTIQSGATLEKLLNVVRASGWCIPCLPDIDKVTVGGALATGTHGTNGYILAKYVSKFRMIHADGTVHEYTEEDDEIEAVRLSLGMLGVISEVTFKCESDYKLHLKEEPMKDKDWVNNLDLYLATYDFVRVLWLPHTNHGYVILGMKVANDFKLEEKAYPSYLKHRRKTSQMLYKKASKKPRFTVRANKILYHLFFTPKKEHLGSLYDATVTKSRAGTMELAEWTVDYTKFKTLFAELKEKLDDKANNAYAHIPMDVRFLKKDGVWLSNAYNADVVTMGCVCRNAEAADAYEAFDLIEEVFLKYDGKPHWAKRFKAKNKELSKMYPKWNEFEAIRKQLDPKGKFLNEYLKRLFVK
ncbi:D-arabinono-1,4-lactone oxidase [Ochrovirga pacifica]|uniref:D-arabinono-1,4-lactone oxidase n=1 Tax=Ochrovirga pacifica TaxID=1042376 RepID=UPI0002557F68|nr:D-arabinono-1,4-lactone oxidase [Ochrovirga pacifica]